MNLLAGLEKFGLDITKGTNLFEEEDKNGNNQNGKDAVEKHDPTEDEFLLEKSVQCKVCDQPFKTKIVKSGRVRRLDPDMDLRPRFQYIDTIKYDVTSCPFCGYTAMNRYFEQITTAQIKLIREEISMKFKSISPKNEVFYSYDDAIERYKLSLINTVVKKGRDSEKAYTCLKISWLLRGKAEEMLVTTDEEKKAKAECKVQEEAFYQQAYDGFILAVSKEMFPMCGMEQNTMDYLLSYMSYHFKKYELAAKYLSSVLTSPSANRRMKDLALDLKGEILAELRKK